MTAEEVTGTICAFYQTPTDVVSCMPKPGAKQLVGAVTRAVPCTNVRGFIPDLLLEVTGRSGKKLNISAVDHYARFFNNWNEAISAAES